MADNWVHGGPAGLIDAAYVWLPLEFGADEVALKKQTAWDLDDPFAPSPPCVPAAGMPLKLAPCGAAAGQRWELPSSGGAGPVKLAGKHTNKHTPLCATTGGARDGEPPLALGGCEQVFNATGGKLVEAGGARRCWDVAWCGGKVCDGEALGLYACNDVHPNQRLAPNAQSQLVSAVDGKCVSVCAE